MFNPNTLHTYTYLFPHRIKRTRPFVNTLITTRNTMDENIQTHK